MKLEIQYMTRMKKKLRATKYKTWNKREPEKTKRLVQGEEIMIGFEKGVDYPNKAHKKST